MPLSSPFLSKSPLVQLSGWWVGLGAVGQNKMCCNLCRLMRLVAALFILRRVGILSVCFSVCLLSAVLSFSMTGNEEGIKEVLKMRDTKHNCLIYDNCLIEVQLFVLRLMPSFLKFLLIFMLYAYSTAATKHHCLKFAHRLFKAMYIQCSTVGSPLEPLQCRVCGLASSFYFFVCKHCAM